MAEKKYITARVSVDPVIFTIDAGKLRVLLHKREKEPGKDRYELPGGLLTGTESAEETLKRKLREVIGREDIFFTPFSAFTEPGRDPRERTISIGCVALVSNNHIKDKIAWYDIDALPQLAFDHKHIIARARAYLKDNIDEVIVKQFMPPFFPLNDLQKAYEIIEQKQYDNRNFRKSMMVSGIVEETKRSEEGVSHRPAKLFTFTKRKEKKGKV